MNRLFSNRNSLRNFKVLIDMPNICSYCTNNSNSRINWKTLKNKTNWKVWTGCIGSGLVLFTYAQYKYYKTQKAFLDFNESFETSKVSTGKADLGGQFDLVDHNGIRRTRDHFKNQWLLMYFGFCHCPDICPDQLEKMVVISNKIDKNPNIPNLLPVFVSVDPERDTAEAVAKYISEFSSKMIGLTGNVDEIKKMAQMYKVYYKSGPKDQQGDYIVDHAIIMFLISPLGECVQYFGQAKAVDEIYSSISEEMRNFSYA